MDRDADITAILPLGLWPMPGRPAEPAELCAADGESLLTRALSEVAQAGMTRAILAVATQRFRPRWLRAALHEATRGLAAEKLALPRMRTLLIEQADSADDLVLQGLIHAETLWSALIAPLCVQPDDRGLAEVRDAVAGSGQPAVMLAPAGWEAAIQLCLPRLHGGRLAGIAYHRDPAPGQIAFAGRALLPSSFRFDPAAPGETGAHDYEQLIAALCDQYPGTTPILSEREVTDARHFLPVSPQPQSRRPAAEPPDLTSGKAFFIALKRRTAEPVVPLPPMIPDQASLPR